VFGADFDDRVACGFAGVRTTALYDAKGRVASRITFDHGRRAKNEILADDGSTREMRETTATGAVERTFWPDGKKRHEVQYANLPSVAAAGSSVTPPSVRTLEQDYAESGQLVRERRWKPTDDGADLVADGTWYLNGQPKTETRIVAGPQGQVRREREFHDDGSLAFEGDWVASASGASRYERRDRPVGTHRTYGANGKKRGEVVYDDRGRLTRERTFDESGAVAKDEEVFEDGSRKAVGK
jgi:antitoxin component YwqK of YwqJK toxin-antitoxin module